ncbi:DUF4314 domain-containing protein [Micromonospora fluostatini]|uniref:DUF4314 domain-containing protein n=1 Tax=Micromonospora sp. JCM 30529 TaxID=3421643 RepID=UPI003D16FE9E
MTYRRGERVALEHTGDPYTLLRPGDEGTVHRYDPDLRVIEVRWDSGSSLSMLLDAGDRVHRLPPAWEQTLDALREAGAQAGRDAAGWWAQHALGGRSTGDVTRTARQVLAGVDDIDPLVRDSLPTVDPDHSDHDAGRYTDHAPAGAPGWETLTGRQRDQTRWAFGDGFTAAVDTETARHCRMALHPHGDDRDMSHLHPDQVHPGRPEVFAGDWAWTPGPDGTMRIPVGYVGVLVDTWNGWAVFTCTPTVARAIVDDHTRARDTHRQDLAEQGFTGRQLDHLVDEAMARLWFDGDTLVADSTRLHHDPDAIERHQPDHEGRYTPMGRAWTWTAVDPYDCDRIVGDTPDPPPTHTPTENPYA